MINSTISSAISKQIQHEQSNAHTYQAVSIYFDRINLHGLEVYMARQVDDERMHAMKFIQHIADRGGQVEFMAITAPKSNLQSPLEAAKLIRDMERMTTSLINQLFELSRKEKDYPLEILLHWFITEQVEEEKWSSELLIELEQFTGDHGQLLTLDQRWGKRIAIN